MNLRHHKPSDDESQPMNDAFYFFYTTLLKLLFVESNPIAVKWLMAKLGMIQPHLRLPLTPLSDQYMDQGVALLDRESNGVNPLLYRFN